MRPTSSLLLFLLAACAGPEHSDAQRFGQTGVVEGFYGPPWSHQDRLDMLRFMGRVGLTHYYYAPKDDPYHRERWSEPYPDAAFRRLGELTTVARESGVVFVYAVSPGGSITYADSADYARLLTKLDGVASLGVTAFALFLDDVLPALQHPADRAAFADLAAAQASLIRRLQRDLAARAASLAVTPTTYTGAWGDREYLRRLATAVPPDIPFFWTGTDVASPEITAVQAAEWSGLIGRPPLVWDNYPVNDFARWRPFLGPVRHRAPDLPRHTAGIIANPMNEAHASMLALATLATYAAAPQSYDPDRVIADAVVQLYGADAAPLLAPLLATYGDYPEDDNPLEPLFIPAAGVDVGAIADRIARLQRTVTTLDSTAGPDGALRALVDEIAPFVTQSANRLAELERSPDWERRGDSLLFRRELDRHRASAAATAITVDGRHSEWPDDAWIQLRGSGRHRPRAAFVTDGNRLYVAVDVPDSTPRPESGGRLGEGDHVALVVQHDGDPLRRALAREDTVVLVAPPSAAGTASTFVGAVPFTGFMAKYLADNRALVWSEFLLSLFGDGTRAERAAPVQAAAIADRDGYRVEVAVPLAGRDVVRLSLSVLDVSPGGRAVFALPRRNYPANPATFAEIMPAK